MDIKMLTKRYSTPMYVKLIGTLLFPAVFILMVVLPVFELIPEEQYINVFNINGVASGDYESKKYTIFTMLQNDYHSNVTIGIFLTFCILAVICGIALLWMNRTKLAAIPAAVLFATVIFSVFRSPFKFFTGVEFWTSVNKSIASVDSYGDATGFVHQYKVDGAFEIFNRFGYYWILWIAAIVLIAFVIFSIVVTKTLIEKKK